MIGKFVIWVEDKQGVITRAFDWTGRASEGIARARADALKKGMNRFDVWATPIANRNAKP